MYIRGLIPRKSMELAEAVPIDANLPLMLDSGLKLEKETEKNINRFIIYAYNCHPL